jgi:hypothetical protein
MGSTRESNNDSHSGEKEEYSQCRKNILLMRNMNQKMISLVTINTDLQVKKGNSDGSCTTAIPIPRDHIFTIDIPEAFLPHPLNTNFTWPESLCMNHLLTKIIPS